MIDLISIEDRINRTLSYTGSYKTIGKLRICTYFLTPFGAICCEISEWACIYTASWDRISECAIGAIFNTSYTGVIRESIIANWTCEHTCIRDVLSIHQWFCWAHANACPSAIISVGAIRAVILACSSRVISEKSSSAVENTEFALGEEGRDSGARRNAGSCWKICVGSGAGANANFVGCICELWILYRANAHTFFRRNLGVCSIWTFSNT